MQRKVLFLLVLGMSLLAFATSPAWGQVATGSISGTTVDATGASVPDVAVTATNQATGAVSKTTSNQDGLFRLALLPPGLYNVQFSKPGFRAIKMADLQVAANTDRGLGQLKLELGEVTQTVEVTAAPPLMETTQAQVTTTITTAQVAQFPGILENQGLDFIALTLPGVSNPRDLSFSNSNGPDFAVNGLRARSNDQQVDGQNNNDNSVAGPGLFLSNVDFVQEYQITTNNFGSEYGRNAGSAVNLITKSGSNNWHGTVSATETNSVLQTRSNVQKAFQGVKRLPRFNDEFSGATIGGPVWKDKVFLFGGFDNEILSRKTLFATGALTPTNIPTLASDKKTILPPGLTQMAACYPGSTSVQALQQFGPYGIGAGNPVPSGAPQTRTLTGSPVMPGGLCPVTFAGVQRVLGHSFHEYDWIYRMDVVFSQSDRLFGRYIFNKSRELNTNAFGAGTAAAGYPADVPAFSQLMLLDWTHTFSSRMVNEFRVGFGRLNVQFGGNSIGNTVPPSSQIGNALARVTMGSGFLGFGPTTNAPQGRVVNTWQVQDNWNYVWGRHQLKAGVNYTFQRSPNIFLPALNGSFNFPNPSRFAQNIPSSVTIALGNPNLDFREHDTFLYVGDDWKIKDNLTLNLGLTWSYFARPYDLFHQLTTKRESNSSTAFWNPALPLSVRTFPSIPAVKNAFGPNVGFAWTPRWGGWITGEGKTVLRGGYRLTYDPPYYNIYLNISTSAPQVLLQTLTGSTAASNPLPAVPTGPNVRTQLASFLTLGVFDPRSFNQTSITPNFGPDRVQEWSFGIQREITSRAVVEARYVGNHGFDLFQSINSNPLVCTRFSGSTCVAGLAVEFPKAVPSGVTPCSPSSAVVPSARGRVNCNEGVLRLRTNTAFSDYNALQLEFRTTNLFNQLNMRTNYTWSKTTDNASEIFGTFGGGGTLAFSQNPFSFTKGEHGLSGLDFPHTWTLSLIEDVPFMRSQQGVLGHILGGWGLSATYIVQSGQTYTPQQFILNFGSGGTTNDVPFNTFIAGVFETLRPFIGNPSAPATSIGIFAADACNLLGVGCSQAPNALIDFTAANQCALPTCAGGTLVTKNQVRFIVNGAFADTTFGTPFGNAARNSLRDAITNSANISFFKFINFGERVKLRWHMTMNNAFNHPNFSSVDPFLDDAGNRSQDNGFGIPQLTSGGFRQIYFGLKVIF